MRNENLYGWIFTFNPYEDEWKATPRENGNTLFSGGKGVLRMKGVGNIMSLVDLVNRTEGEELKINQLLHG
jgi:hypothetical protein